MGKRKRDAVLGDRGIFTKNRFGSHSTTFMRNLLTHFSLTSTLEQVSSPTFLCFTFWSDNSSQRGVCQSEDARLAHSCLALAVAHFHVSEGCKSFRTAILQFGTAIALGCFATWTVALGLASNQECKDDDKQ